MSENKVTIYWPGEPFDFTHHARKHRIEQGDNSLPESMAKRLRGQFSICGMVEEPRPTIEKDGTVTPPSDSTIAAVKAAADKRYAGSLRRPGTGAVLDGEGKPAKRALPTLRELPGAKLEEPAKEEAKNETDEKPAKPEKKTKAEKKPKDAQPAEGA